MLYEKERQEVVDTCLFMVEENLVVGTAGNVSIRIGDHVVISPSGVDYATMTAKDVVVYDMAGNRVDGDLKPSSELPLHIAVYEATDAQAITHNHAYASTALGLLVDEIPPSHYYSAMFGGVVRVAPYAAFGTDELADNVAAALDGRTGALMKNHGAITIGPSLTKAVNLLPILEYICEIQLRAMSTGAPIALLDEEQMAEAVVGMASYGKQPERK
ncbi:MULTISPECIES: class II aldolase/adducin family protein [Trueperella]|uniref:Class II aldolase/adducin family protein n=1 Tax=Trueperella bernardiae TaxID=59561 RepID=A0A0W1KJM4_9ACTO|nr:MULTISPECIES: class II aldolase/adducin family protein [Trueperella]KTF03824.1 L-fuculose phosphate aldolase [Trueperella bernardiae]MCM3908167.1 class II aldolase/adducin family protein [Trueperella bernardiae]MDK8602149.1 class II aldolase/adducin family protein [Trueperella bernardiae]MDV6239235.1 class II aldolase/adducin family protein [Trueperella bernardiae]OCW59955.1 fuculose phosphate aldolase [Trueperella bernardiae]